MSVPRWSRSGESVPGYAAGKRRALLGKMAWKMIQERYESLREENGLPVTYELVIGYSVAGR